MFGDGVDILIPGRNLLTENQLGFLEAQILTYGKGQALNLKPKKRQGTSRIEEVDSHNEGNLGISRYKNFSTIRISKWVVLGGRSI